MQELEGNAHHLGGGERCHREVKAAQAQRGQRDQQRGERAQQHARQHRDRQRPAEHRRADAGGISADAEEGLLPERQLAGDEQQISRER